MPPGTERDDRRFELLLEDYKEMNQRIIEMTKMVQRGFEAIGQEQGAQHARLRTLEHQAVEHRAALEVCKMGMADLGAHGLQRSRLLWIAVVLLSMTLLAALAAAYELFVVMNRLFGV